MLKILFKAKGLLLLLLVSVFIPACEDSPSSQQISPEEISELIEEGSDRIGRRGRGRRSGGGSRSSGGGTSDNNDDDDIDDDTDDDNDIPFELSRLNQISRLMARGEYEEAAELSEGPFPELSDLIEDGNYQAASVLLSRMLIYLSR